METKTFNVVTFLSMVLTVTAAVLSIAGMAITGFYPAIVVLLALAVVPIASRHYAGKVNGAAGGQWKKYHTPLIIVNALLILVVLWMAFVIVHDRVLGDCC